MVKNLSEQALSMFDKKMDFGRSWLGYKFWRNSTRILRLENLLESNKSLNNFGLNTVAIIIADTIMKIVKKRRLI